MSVLEQLDRLTRELASDIPAHIILLDKNGTIVAEHGGMSSSGEWPEISAAAVAAAGGMAGWMEASGFRPPPDEAVHVQLVASRVILVVRCKREQLDAARLRTKRFMADATALFE